MGTSTGRLASVSALRRRTEKLTIEFDGLEINFEAAVRRYDRNLEEEIRRQETLPGGLVKLLARVVVSWDLLESDEPDAQPYPITDESLSALPVEFLSRVAEAITAAQGPNSGTTTSSAPT